MSNYQKPKHSMRKKLMLLYMPLLLIPLIAFALISNHYYRQAIVQRSLSSMFDHASIMATQVDAKISAANNCATQLTLDIDKLFTTTPIDASPQERLRYETSLSSALSYARLVYPDIHSIVFIDIENRMYSTYAQMNLTDPQGEADTYLQPLYASAGNRLWFPAQKRTWLNVPDGGPVMTLGKKVWHTQTGKTIGYLLINLMPSNLTEGFSQDLSSYHLVDQTSLVFARHDSEVAGQVAQHMADASKSLHENRMMVKVPLKNLPLSIIGYGDLNEHTPDLKQASSLLGIAAAMTIFVLLQFTWFSHRFIVEPIKTLHSGVEAISEGRFTHRLPETQQDELGMLAAHINRMSTRIETLMEREVTMATRRRTLELERLQEQIKPHFLYNTLDIITKLMEMGDLRRARRASTKLASFYQHSLAEGSEILPLRKEIELIEDYMAIQNIRYGDAFQLKITVPEALDSLPIPKLTLQPLIENAIYHGLKTVSREGYIGIEATCDQAGSVSLVLWDNGQGMDPESIEAINKHLEDPTSQTFHSKSGFGLLSVAERLNLYYGDATTMTFSQRVLPSGVIEGINVTLKIPSGGSLC
jgi:two-component system sensor histidine kinase YesM